MKKVNLIILVIFFSLAAPAQKIAGLVKGTLQDSVSASPLEDATVSVTRLPDSTLISFTLSNCYGYFEIKNMEGGDYQLVVSYTGLRSFKRLFTLSAANAGSRRHHHFIAGGPELRMDSTF